MAIRWYALAVRARQEKAAARAVEALTSDVYLPLRIQRHAWSDRVKAVEIAVFPGYLFVKTEMSARHRVELLKLRHVVEVVGRRPDEHVAQPIPDAEIENLRAVLATNAQLDPVARLVRGTAVLVASGPLKGVHGIVHRRPDGRRRLIVQIELLGRGVAAELGADDVVDL